MKADEEQSNYIIRYRKTIESLDIHGVASAPGSSCNKQGHEAKSPSIG